MIDEFNVRSVVRRNALMQHRFRFQVICRVNRGSRSIYKLMKTAGEVIFINLQLILYTYN